jgi:hypothetical protein
MATHHDINQAVLLEYNQKRIDKLERKQQPKTQIDRQRSFYYLLLVVAVVCELVDCILTFSGIIHFSSERLSDKGFILFGVIGFAVVLLSVFKHKTMDIFHAQRLDDEFVPKSTYAFMLAFFVISAAATYNVTPAALEYLTKTPALASVDSVSLRFDSLLAADMVVIAKEIETHSTTAKAIHKASNWKGKLDLNSQTKYENALGNKNEATARKTAIVLARNAEKETAINFVQSKNDAIIKKHKDWCVNFGFWLSIAFVLVEFILYPAKWFCENYERLEVIEAKKKKAAKEAEQAFNQNIKVEDKEVKEKDKVEVPEKTKVVDNQEKTTIGFVHNEGKEGDIVKGEGKVRDRVLVMVNGALVAKTKGELNTLIRGQSTSERIKHLENIKTKLN